jgi:hypothetical protein
MLPSDPEGVGILAIVSECIFWQKIKRKLFTVFVFTGHLKDFLRQKNLKKFLQIKKNPVFLSLVADGQHRFTAGGTCISAASHLADHNADIIRRQVIDWEIAFLVKTVDSAGLPIQGSQSVEPVVRITPRHFYWCCKAGFLYGGTP